MGRLARDVFSLAGFFVFLALLCGCATQERRVSLLYHPLVSARGGAGELFLAYPDGRGDAGKPGQARWIIGKVKGGVGGEANDIVSPVAPGDLVVDAFNQELHSAGYDVKRVTALPAGAKKGVVVSRVEIDLQEESGVLRLEGSCRMTVSIDLVKNGKGLKNLFYESRLSDVAVTSRGLLSHNLLQKTIQDLMRQAVPDIIGQLGQ